MTELTVATDIYDEVHQNECFPDPQHLKSLMAYCRSLGATRLDWILDDMWAMYETYPGGIDFLKTAIDAAHAEGLKFHVVYKPDEGGLTLIELPQTAPRPDGAVFWEDLRGLNPIVRPFVAAHPEMCLKRRPGDEDPGGRLRAIRLIKDDNEPVNLAAEDVSIWVSDVNGRFDRYAGSFTVQEESAWRLSFPMGRTCRVVTINGLNIPADQRYVEVRLADGALKDQSFRNEYEHLVELINERGELIPCTPAVAAPPGLRYAEQLAKPYMSQLVRYAHHPEVQAFLNDPATVAAHAGETRAYGRAPNASRVCALHEKRHLAVARGKTPYFSSRLNPVYPEVREHWLEAVRFAIERGADAVDIRLGAHGRLQESWLYGFNEPVLEALNGEIDLARARRIIGDGYTQFMRQARDLLHDHGRQMGVHLLNNFLLPRDEPGDRSLENAEHQWETWVAEIADFVTIRGAMGLREESIRYMVDRFTRACREANIPAVYQSNRRIYTQKPDALHLNPDRLKYLIYEMEYASSHPGITGYQLYETAYFTRLSAGGRFEGSEDIREAVRRCGFTPMA